ncbi:hypothetical protein M9H77_07733 [Catharanthus roseus]|uniref:Uncharacterized protein n=1 Tax=Catharanthus roseus TaxID=4058 RepID=A0ACC0BW64_CATRO|nr:hypothetical protein M9H77_07733 [Catharanthus roseus]
MRELLQVASWFLLFLRLACKGCSSKKESDPWKGVEYKVTIKVDLHQVILEQPLIEGFQDIYLNTENEFHHVQRMQQALKGLEQQLSYLAKGVKDLKKRRGIQL